MKKILLILMPCLLALVGSHAAATKPNVVLMMCDDLGWGDVGFNGNKTIKTPHLDRMAANGLKFTDFKLGYHESRLPEVRPERPNTPVELPNDYDAVRRAIDAHAKHLS